jgi:fatty-acid desaturase
MKKILLLLIILLHIAIPFVLLAVENMWMFVFGCVVAFYISQWFGMAMAQHKLFSHRQFVPYTWVAILGALVNVLFWKDSPQRFAIIHRIHHKYSDTDLDPHSPKERWYHAYGIMFFASTNLKKIPIPEQHKIVEDLFKDFPWIRMFTVKNQLLLISVFYLLLWFISYDLAAAVFIASIISMHVTCSTNVLGHVKHNGVMTMVDRPLLATFVSPTFNHAQHHNNPSNYDESNKNSFDTTAWLIRKFLAKSITP